MSASMSTPVHQLPTNKPTTATIPDDPEVLNVIQEMEQEVKSAAKANSVPMPSPPMLPPTPYMSPTQMGPPPTMVIKSSSGCKWMNFDKMQHAAVVGAIALIAFYPQTLELVYSIPKLAFLEQFDIIVRAAIVAVVVYVVSVQFGM